MSIAQTSQLAVVTRRRGGLLTAGDVLLVLIAGALVVVALWLRDGGLSEGGKLISIGLLTGLLGTYLVLVQLVLIARLPWLERTIGFDRLTVWHARNGRAAISLLVAHMVFIVVGYASTERRSLPAELWSQITTLPGILTATVGMALLLAVVVTSVVIVRRRLRYETWYFVHLYAYLGIALAFSHQLAIGRDFAGDPLARAYWYAIYLAALATLVVWRLLVPLARALHHRLRVTSVVEEVPGVFSLSIAGKHLDALDVEPGQFFMWRFLTPSGWWQAHPFSVSAVPHAHSLRVTVKALGDFTGEIGRLAPGTRVVAEGPFGTFTAARRTRSDVLFIAGGVGITPIRTLVESMPSRGGSLALIYRAIHAGELIFRDELDRLAEMRGMPVHYAIGDHRDPRQRHLLSSQHLRELVPDIATRDVFLCGPPAMTGATVSALRRAGVAREQIHTEAFAY